MVDDAELVTVRIPENDEVRVLGIGPVLDGVRAQLDETLDVACLLAGVQVHVHAPVHAIPIRRAAGTTADGSPSESTSLMNSGSQPSSRCR